MLSVIRPINHNILHLFWWQIQPKSSHVDRKEKVSEIRKTRGGAILDPDDKLNQVLDDNDFVSVGNDQNFKHHYGHHWQSFLPNPHE